MDSRWTARLVVGGLAVAILAAGALEAEWWPVSSMRLFSETRSGEATGYEILLVRGDGSTERLDASALGRGFRGAHQLIPRMRDMDADRRGPICRAWLDAAPEGLDRGEATDIRVDAVVRTVPTERDEAPVEIARRELFTCG